MKVQFMQSKPTANETDHQMAIGRPEDDDSTTRRHRVSLAEGRAYQAAGLRVIFHRTYAIVVATNCQLAAAAERLLH
jgi:hypothetical protein